MKHVKRWLWLGVPLALAACGSDDNVGQGGFMADTLVRAMEASDVAVIFPPGDTSAAARAAAGGMSASLQPVNNSNYAGEVSLNAAGEQTQVVVRMTAPTAGTHQGHIHSGRCASPGGVVAPLEPITTDASSGGSSTSTVSVPIGTVMNGQHIVQYHQRGGSSGAPVACADIPQHAM